MQIIIYSAKKKGRGEPLLTINVAAKLEANLILAVVWFSPSALLLPAVASV